MNSKIQQLTESIYNEGVQKAREDADAIIKEAKEKAASIERDARKKADQLMKETKEKSQELKTQVDSEIKMSLNHYGLWISHCLNGMMKQKGSLLCTIHLHRQKLKILNCWILIREKCGQMLMTW